MCPLVQSCTCGKGLFSAFGHAGVRVRPGREQLVLPKYVCELTRPPRAYKVLQCF